MKIISKRIGTAASGFTVDAYAHLLPSADEEIAQTLARLILGEAG